MSDERNKQIEEAIKEKNLNLDQQHGFIYGAKWADEFPEFPKLTEGYVNALEAMFKLEKAILQQMLAIAEEALEHYSQFNNGNRAEEALAKIAELKK